MRARRVIIYGINPVLEALRAGRVKELRVGERADDRLRQLLALADERGVRVRRVPVDTLERESRRGVHQGVVADVEKAPNYSVDELVRGASGRAARSWCSTASRIRTISARF